MKDRFVSEVAASSIDNRSEHRELYVAEDTPISVASPKVGERVTAIIKNELHTHSDYNGILKKEPFEEKNDGALGDLEEQNDMFEDVDEPEYVDHNYEGLAEVDGVEHFVCEGL